MLSIASIVIDTAPIAPQLSGGQSMSFEEKEVLKYTSKINGKLYLPFFEGDLTEDFKSTSGKFTDPVFQFLSCLRT